MSAAVAEREEGRHPRHALGVQDSLCGRDEEGDRQRVLDDAEPLAERWVGLAVLPVRAAVARVQREPDAARLLDERLEKVGPDL